MKYIILLVLSHIMFFILGYSIYVYNDNFYVEKKTLNVEEKIDSNFKSMLKNSSDFNGLDNIYQTRNMIKEQYFNKKSIDFNIIVEDKYILNEIDDVNIRIRIYKPKNMNKSLPVLIWFHGGGYVFGIPEVNEDLLIQIVKNLDCIVIAPDYRLAPENRYPAAINDCYQTLLWTIKNKDILMINEQKVAIGGISAGGGLATALALKARDENGPKICFVMALYPMLDDRNKTLSSYQITDKRLWNRDINIKAWNLYLGENYNKNNVPIYAAPSRAMNLENLPSTYIMIGSLDLFRDEAIEYAQRLLQSGVNVELHVYPGGVHVFDKALPEADISIKAKTEYIEALKKAFFYDNAY